MKQLLYLLFGFSLLLFSCTKNGIEQLSNPSFTAKVNGKPVAFMSPVTVRALKNANGFSELHIEGREDITNDSNTVILFVIPDFTVSGGRSSDHQLNTQFNGNFIEWKHTATSAKGRYHYFQNGQLSVQLDAGSYLKGSFSFTYFLFDQLGNKTGEVAVTEGNFSDLIIER